MVGSLNMDLVAIAPRIPVVGETIIGDTYFTEPGGKGANQAYAAGLLGGSVAMLGRIGKDDFGQEMRNNLLKVGCDVEGIRVEEGVSGVALIFVSSTGQNSIIVVPGANTKFAPEHIRADSKYLAGTKVVLLQLENPTPTVLEAARESRKAGAKVILDPAPAPESPLPDELFRCVDVLTPNETEGAILAGLPPGRLEPQQAARLGRQLQSKGAATVVMKLGDQGCVIVDKGDPLWLSAPKVDAKDTTAAGDVFNAALSVGLSEGLDMQAACRFANYAASLSVTRLGAQVAVPTRKEVDEFASSAAVKPPQTVSA
ncbi:MAG TPA: ribokinase [Candidatus Saccharimonadales bacterium]|nr:ribokinase [Candidatus Saccharimonadales bacterium]